MRLRAAALDYPPPMIYRFDAFELDPAAGELRAGDGLVPLEPQVFALLVLLVENRERLVSKDEIVERVWDGRPVSDSAISSRVKAARQALGDDGATQRFIRTLHRRGFRFVAAVTVATRADSPGVPERDRTPEPRVAGRAEDGIAHARTSDAGVGGPSGELDAASIAPVARPSLAVLPFACLGSPAGLEPLGDALAHDLIVDLSRLHWLFVTARGSSFRFRPPDADPSAAARVLGVRYVLGGTIEAAAGRATVHAQLMDSRDGGIVWAERFEGALDGVHAIREEIRSRVLVELDLRIPLHEASLARLVVPARLDAWAAYHLGLQHVYRFNRADNARAYALFSRAVELEPTFARAHAGLSFVHFQTAFLRHTDDLVAEAAAARHAAERGLEFDPLDPFVNFTMGRTFWLEGDLETSLGWLERATHVSPNYAQGIYARAWTETLSGRANDARGHVDTAMRLSPLDPLYYAMLGTRALIHVGANDAAEAAAWAERAARAPGAHPLIAMIAAVAHRLNGDAARAGSWAADARARNSRLTSEDFFRAFPVKPVEMRARVHGALAALGF
jgi:TolB-like protein/DNA-binding winged helix-turn-helix (wHTH) protein/Flp pilus assembly protein TadD